MIGETDGTHDPSLQSWVATANAEEADFPIQNLPFGVFRRRDARESARIGVAIGDRVLDLGACAKAGLLEGVPASLGRFMGDDSLNRLMGEGREAARMLRRAATAILQMGNVSAQRRADAIAIALTDVELLLPVHVGDYSDFYASVDHATNVGSMFRPDNPLLPNYRYVPIGYHGRASSLVMSGTAVKRPRGQTRDDAQAPPTFGPTRRLDYELEVGAYVAPGNALGAPIPIGEAEQHLWGVSLVNDWSARDIQTWEYQPLGPFLAKSFATTVSPWVVTLDALAPFRTAPPVRGNGEPQPLPYLANEDDRASGAIDLTLEVWLQSVQMRREGRAAVRLSSASFRQMYWTFAQMLAHHSSNGCNMRTGDLIASGTVSNAAKDSRGCLLELTWRGEEPITLPSGEKRTFLADGDEVVMRGYGQRDGARRIGLGECRGTVAPAP
ncbi:MAG TPA: fumarylacetoacetase [Gemmatimonadaceae bacterium]|nr:fumarylacetoacetase [Gemmatimonadaceae bacterium]